MPLADSSRVRLRDIARQSIRHGLTYGQPPVLELAEQPADLKEPGATFVTLHIDQRLRGCIGTLEAHRPLVEDVNDNAFAAAFRDSRFPTLTPGEEPKLKIHIALLRPPTELPCENEADLLRKLRPGVDGLILRDGPYRATFLPAVWDDVPRPRDFLQHLKLKAGLPPAHWSTTLRFWRYETESI